MAMTNAERQARFRARKKAAGLLVKTLWVNPATATDQKAVGKDKKKAAADQKAHTHAVDAAYARGASAGRINAVTLIASKLIDRDAANIAEFFLHDFYITQQDCKKYVENSTLKKIAPYLYTRT
jgi:hypothetical protein